MNTWAHACCATVSIAWKRRQACQVCQFRVDRCFSFWWTFRGYLCSLDPTVGIGEPDLVRSCLLLAVRLAGCGLICIDLLRMMFPSAYPSKWQDIKKKKKSNHFMEWMISVPDLFFGIKIIKTLTPNIQLIYLKQPSYIHASFWKKCFIIQLQMKFTANIYHLKYKWEYIGWNDEQAFLLFLKILPSFCTLVLIGYYSNTHRVLRIAVTSI